MGFGRLGVPRVGGKVLKVNIEKIKETCMGLFALPDFGQSNDNDGEWAQSFFSFFFFFCFSLVIFLAKRCGLTSI